MTAYWRIAAKTIVIILRIVLWIAVFYAIFFSIAATMALAYAAWRIYTPFKQVQSLAKQNPQASVYMESIRRSLGPGDTLRHIFTPLDSISPNLVKAVIASEDDGFWVHPGFDLNAIVAAYERNRIAGKVEFGGSTITQQVAKNFFLSSNRSFARKVKELGYTVLLEKYLGKKRIMELYLNYAQWGKTIFGCEAASRAYFNKSCKNLTMWESARLAAMLAKPGSVDPRNARSSFLGKRLQVIADNLYTKGMIDDSGYITISGREPPHKDSTAAQPAPEETDNNAARGE